MKMAIAWGCLVPSRRSLLGYEAATRKVLQHLGVNVIDVPNETCCAPFWMQSLDQTTSLALASRNLAKAEEMGLSAVVDNLKKAGDTLALSLMVIGRETQY